MLKAANHNAHQTLSFCNGITQESFPFEALCRPLLNKPFNECFHIVEEYINNNGGERIIGWAIWERPGTFIEAEFHAI